MGQKLINVEYSVTNLIFKSNSVSDIDLFRIRGNNRRSFLTMYIRSCRDGHALLSSYRAFTICAFFVAKIKLTIHAMGRADNLAQLSPLTSPLHTMHI